MATAQLYPSLKTVLVKLSEELVESIQSRWAGDWSQQVPRVGVHFNYWDVKALPSFNAASAELKRIPLVSDKYSEDSLDKPLVAFLELVVGSLPHPSFLPKAIEHWWKPFALFLTATELPIRLFVGLSNFEADRPLYRLDHENAICFYGDGSLGGVIERSVNPPSPEPFPSTGLPMHMIHGAIEVDFSLPANQNNLQYGHYSHDCIHRMLPLKNALRLSTFGRLVVGPWIPLCNPSFPVDGVYAIGSPEEGSRFSEPLFRLDDPAWQRFEEVYRHLKQIQDENGKDIEQNRAIRRRFASAISRFIDTFEQGYWESVVVDLVIVMESLLTPNKQGGRMQLALAASNLVGNDPMEAREVFDNVTAMYRLRNQNVHGEPTTQETWDARILEIARAAGSSATSLDDGIREYAFEVMRDYARRTIVSMLNLYYDASYPPSEELTSHLHRLHLDKTLRQFIRSAAKANPLAERPSPPR